MNIGGIDMIITILEISTERNTINIDIIFIELRTITILLH